MPQSDAPLYHNQTQLNQTTTNKMTKTVTQGLVTGTFTTPDHTETRTETTISWASVGARPIEDAKQLIADTQLVIEVLEQWERNHMRTSKQLQAATLALKNS